MITDTTTMKELALWRRVLLITMFAAAGLMSSLASAATLDEIKKRGYMVVVTEDDFRPFEYIQDGKPVGYDNELVEKLRKFVPFEIRQQIIPWTGLLAGGQHRQIRYRHHCRDYHKGAPAIARFLDADRRGDRLLPEAQER